MPIDLVIDEREGAGSTTSKSPENPDPSDLQDPVSTRFLICSFLCVIFSCLIHVYVCCVDLEWSVFLTSVFSHHPSENILYFSCCFFFLVPRQYFEHFLADFLPSLALTRHRTNWDIILISSTISINQMQLFICAKNSPISLKWLYLDVGNWLRDCSIEMQKMSNDLHSNILFCFFQ